MGQVSEAPVQRLDNPTAIFNRDATKCDDGSDVAKTCLCGHDGSTKNHNQVMATSVKSKLIGLLRSLLRQFEGDEIPRPAAAAALGTVASGAQAANSSSPKNMASANEIELPLRPIVTALPMDLRAKLMSVPAPEATIRLPVELVMSQLAFGAVKISFGELRQFAPEIFANTGGELDKQPVSLPLGEILARLNPALLARRQTKKVEVAEELAGPFAGRGTGVTFTTQPLKAPIAIPPLVPTPAPLPSIAFTPPAPRQVAPSPAAPPPPMLPRPASGRALPPSRQFSEPVPPTIFASLSDLSENWPEELRNEISCSPLANANVLLTGNIIEPGLKRGRVAMTWKQLRTLAQPSSAASANDNLELELPLKVIALLFLAAKKKSLRAQPKVSVSPEIPDLFFGFPQPSAPPVPVVPALPRPPEQKNAGTNYYVRGEKGEAPQADEAALRRGENSQTDFLNWQAHPKDGVLRAAQLPGVAGALVALPDGLRVASQVPADLNADMLAAFLPQIFERVNQSTRELGMGALNNGSL